MALVVKAIANVNATVFVGVIIGLEGGEDTELYSRSVTVFLNGANNLDSHVLVASSIAGLHDLAKSALA
jgi:hypothetical protein